MYNSLKLKTVLYFPALYNKNFRYYWVGQCISLIGTWIQTTALSWLVYTLSHSPFLLGLSVAVSAIPLLLLSPFAGAIHDKFSDKKVLMLSQILLIIISLTIAFLVWSGNIRYWHLLIFSLLSGTVNAVILPTRQTFIYKLVGKRDLVNGIALNSVAFNAARMIGPTLAGLLMVYAGVSICFFINSLCFIPLTYWIYKMNVPPVKASNTSNILIDIKDAFTYILGNKTLYKTLLISTIIGMLAMNYSVLTPVLVNDILNKSSMGYAMLLSFMGIGSLFGALFMAVKSKSSFGAKALIVIPLCTSLLFIFLGFIKSVFIIIPIYIIYGFCITVFATVSNSIMMLNANDAMRLRVISIYTLFFTGTNPIGGLVVGTLADQLGISACHILLGIIICFLTYIISKKF